VPHLGADDNASGTAAVLELARRLARAPMRRPVLFVNFSAEELGEIGSLVFVLNAPIPVDSIVSMFNFDMVGRLRSGHLDLYGLRSSHDWRRLVDSANTQPRLALDKYDELDRPRSGSDHDRFFVFGVPVLHFFTGLHADYHTKNDTFDRINFDGMIQVIDFAERVIRSVGDRADVPARTKRP
jgi:Zn-dependent M28 family amino/carboxypeptidase